MTDLRAEATRIGYWDEGLAQYAAPDRDLGVEMEALARSLMARGIISAPGREDPTHECD